MAKTKRKQERVAITLQCVVGEDDDLIAWYQTIPQPKQRHVMEVLREALGYEPREQRSIYAPASEEEVRRVVAEQLDTHIESVIGRLLDERIKQLIMPEIKKMDGSLDEMWTAMKREIAAAVRSQDYTGGSIFEPIREKVSDDVLEERKNNILKDKW